jgi:hypothetical protein
MLGIPPSTLRRYVSDFADFLSPEATQPRARRFNQTDLAALAKIRQGLYIDKIPVEKLKEELSAIVGDPLKAERALVEYEPINKALTSIRSDVTGILSRLEALEEKVNQPPWWKRLFGGSPD